MTKSLINIVSLEQREAYARAKWAIEESVPESFEQVGTQFYCPPILAGFVTPLGTVYGFNEDTIFYFDESDGIGQVGGSWHYDQHHDCNELSMENIAHFLNVTITHIIKDIPKKTCNIDIAMALIYLSKGFQENRTQWDKLADHEGIGEDEILRQLYPHAVGVENVWILCEEKDYKASGMWLFDVVEKMGIEFSNIGRVPTSDEALQILLQMIHVWMEIPLSDMERNLRQITCAYKSAF